jgi:hypothetical protein
MERRQVVAVRVALQQRRQTEQPTQAAAAVVSRQLLDYPAALVVAVLCF